MHDRPVRALLDYWFGPLDDATPLDREAEPFRTHFARWYGKDPAVDADIRARFEPTLLAVAGSPLGWSAELAAWEALPGGLVALIVLLDQLPRNMYRETSHMYRYDTLAQSATTVASRAADLDAWPLPWRMFVFLPWMHAECEPTQTEMVRRFEGLLEAARSRSPQNVGFYAYALDFAHRHHAVVAEFGRFPHRNPLLGRSSTPAEERYLAQPGAGF